MNVKLIFSTNLLSKRNFRIEIRSESALEIGKIQNRLWPLTYTVTPHEPYTCSRLQKVDIFKQSEPEIS